MSQNWSQDVQVAIICDFWTPYSLAYYEPMELCSKYISERWALRYV
jgi:hypothetical protein